MQICSSCDELVIIIIVSVRLGREETEERRTVVTVTHHTWVEQPVD